MISQFDHLEVTVDDGVATVVLNRPHVLNACEPKTHRELAAAFDELDVADAVRAVILTGAGRAFCAGSDLRTAGNLHGADASRYVELDFATKNRVAGLSKPVVAAVNGHCVGGGFELALACDIRIAADDAIFALPEITLGTIPGSGGLQRLPQVVGLGIAKEWALSGRDVRSDEAFRTGLVNAVVPKDELRAAAERQARLFASRDATALRYAKAALDPGPPSNFGLVAAFHGLASRACHDQPEYERQTKEFAGEEPR